MKNADCSLVDNLIGKKLILPTFRSDAPVLLKARVKLSRGTSQFIGSSWHAATLDHEEPINCEVPRLSFTLALRRTGASGRNVGQDKFLSYQVVYKRTVSIFSRLYVFNTPSLYLLLPKPIIGRCFTLCIGQHYQLCYIQKHDLHY